MNSRPFSNCTCICTLHPKLLGANWMIAAAVLEGTYCLSPSDFTLLSRPFEAVFFSPPQLIRKRFKAITSTIPLIGEIAVDVATATSIRVRSCCWNSQRDRLHFGIKLALHHVLDGYGICVAVNYIFETLIV